MNGLLHLFDSWNLRNDRVLLLLIVFLGERICRLRSWTVQNFISEGLSLTGVSVCSQGSQVARLVNLTIQAHEAVECVKNDAVCVRVSPVAVGLTHAIEGLKPDPFDALLVVVNRNLVDLLSGFQSPNVA